MRNKGRFEYVDQLRKISTIQKMGYVQSFYPQTFEENKQEKAKFIRYKEELILQQQPQKQDVLFGNNIIAEYKKDEEAQINEIYIDKNENLTKDIGYYHAWSQSLNQEINERDYKHRFYFNHAQPPPRQKEEPKQKNKKDQDGTAGGKNNTNQDNNEEANEDTSIDIPHRGKYNFQDITKHIFSGDEYLDKKEGNFMRDNSLKDEITEYRKLKNLSQIEKIGDFHEEFKKFQYYVQPIEDLYEIDFIDNSVIIGNTNMNINFFRDIGAPSRDIMSYTVKNNEIKYFQYSKIPKSTQGEQYKRNRDLLYLYFLHEDQLKINKTGLTFLDVANISMGRITPYNAHLCVRNEKITQAQYDQLIQRMMSQNMKEDDGSKPTEEKEVGTEELQEKQTPQKGEDIKDFKESAINIETIIEEINKIKKEVRIIQNQKSSNNFDRNNFNSEVYRKLKYFLNLLYQSVTEDTEVKYPFNEISSHLDEIKGSTDLGYDKIRVLLFIANSYDEIFSKQQKTPNLRDLLAKKPKETTITTYKGKKIVSSINPSSQKNDKKNKTPTKQIPVRDKQKDNKNTKKVIKI